MNATKLRTIIKIHIDCCPWTALRYKSNHWISSLYDLLFVFHLIHCKYCMDMHISSDIEFECESIEFMFHCQSQFNLAYCSFHYTVNMQPDAKYSMQQYFFKIESVVFLLHSIWLTVIETEFENIFLLTLEWCKAINSLSIAYRF